EQGRCHGATKWDRCGKCRRRLWMILLQCCRTATATRCLRGAGEMQTRCPRKASRVTVPSHYSGGYRMPRLRHLAAYAAVGVAGDFVEAGDRGRYRLGAGTVAFHSAFEAHQDDFGRAGAVVLDLPLSRCPAWTTGVLDEVDAVARLASRDVHAAAALLVEHVQPSVVEVADWPDELARALADEPRLCLGDWAEGMGLSPQTLSRGFR